MDFGSRLVSQEPPSLPLAASQLLDASRLSAKEQGEGKVVCKELNLNSGMEKKM
jgi:hypothetical protein